MAKDPAFLFYDGDAAKDVSHLNRLERGCYFDLIQAQRKFGGYTTEQARKILGRDFDECWPAIEMILSKNEDGIYYIDWITESTKKRAQYIDNQRKRIKNYWDKKKEKEKKESVYRGITTDLPLENEIIYNNTILNNNISYIENTTIVREEKKPKSKSKKLNFPIFSDFNGLPEINVGASIELIRITQHVDVSKEDINSLWEVFKIQYLTGEKFYSSEKDVYSHFTSWVRKIEVKNTLKNNKNEKLGTSEGQLAAARRFITGE